MKKLKLHLAVCFLCCNIVAALSAQPPYSQPDASYRSITMDDGLPSNTVRRMVQDGCGFIWMGTDNGLCRYDGIQVLTYRIPQLGNNQYVSALLADGQRVYVGTEQGVFRLNVADDHFEHLEAAGVPLVFYDRICPALNASRVVVDDYMGTMNAVSHLIETGCKRIAFYGASMNMMIAKNRFNGYRDALYKYGLTLDEDLVRICDNRADAERITPAMMRMGNRPDAFFAVNDETAIGILSVVKRMGYTVPDDVSICGFTNGFRATVCDPMLTTVEQRGTQVGKEAADILIGLVEGTLSPDHAEKRIVKTRLVIRGTTRHP